MYFHLLLKVYTLAEDIYKGKAKQIGAAGLEILYYKIQDGTEYTESENFKKFLKRMILEEIVDVNLISSTILE